MGFRGSLSGTSCLLVQDIVYIVADQDASVPPSNSDLYCCCLSLVLHDTNAVFVPKMGFRGL